MGPGHVVCYFVEAYEPREAMVGLEKQCSCLGLAELLSEAGVKGAGLQAQRGLDREGGWMSTFPDKEMLGWTVGEYFFCW